MRKQCTIVAICLLLFAALGMVAAAADIQTEGIVAVDAADMEETTADTMTQEPSAEADGAELPTTMEEWDVYIKKEIIPVVVFIFTSVAAVYVAILPVLVKVKEASEKFKSATKDVNKASSETEQNKNDIAALGAELKTMLAELKEIKTGIGAVQTITKIGFGNFTELIEKGYAHEIEKVGEEEHEEQTS